MKPVRVIWVALIMSALLLLSSCGANSEEVQFLQAENERLTNTVSALESELEHLKDQIPDKEEETPEWSSVYFKNGAFILPESKAAEQPEMCSSFFDIAWGGGYDALFVDPNANTVEQKGVEYAGIMGSAFYSFSEGVLSRGQIAFYAMPDKSDIDIFIDLWAYLIEIYGAPQSSDFELSESAMNEGKSYSVVWKVYTGSGQPIQISLVYGVNAQTQLAGKTALWFSVV